VVDSHPKLLVLFKKKNALTSYANKSSHENKNEKYFLSSPLLFLDHSFSLFKKKQLWCQKCLEDLETVL
jgi:hypothetical protein